MSKRLIAALLCFLIAVSCIAPALSVSASDISTIYHDGQSVSTVSFPSNKTTDISVAGVGGCEGYQWQINVPGTEMWVDIYGETGTRLTLSNALIANMLSGNAAQIRCAMATAEGEVYSSTVAVSTTEAEHAETALPEYVPAAAPVNEAVQPTDAPTEPPVTEAPTEPAATDAPEATEATEPQRVMMFAARPRTVLPTYTIEIQYLFKDDTKAAESWIGTFTEGTAYNLDVSSPAVNGYEAEFAKIEKTYDAITQNETIKVYYEPVHVQYTIKHWQQNVSDDNYTEVTADRVENKNKYPNELIGDGWEKTYPGFKQLDYDTTLAIAADGSTVLNIYYDRLYYLMSFDLDGGYGVEPIYARVGTSVSVGNPSKAGYSFKSWNPGVPAAMPVGGGRYKATWEAGKNVNVNLVFWYENANDSDYSYAGSKTVTTTYTAGKTVKPSDYQGQSFTGRDNYHFIFNANKDNAVALNADGSTIVNVYFTRKTYRMIFFNCYICATNEDTNACYPSSYTAALNFINNKNIKDCVDKYYNDGSTGIGHEWKISVYTRKWQQDVRPDWAKGIAGRNATRRWMPYEVKGDNGKLIYNGGLNVSTMNAMPDADVIFRFLKEGSLTCTMNYWITPVGGSAATGDTTKKADNVTYVLKDKVVTKMGGITENEEYVDIEGFTKVYTWAQLASKDYRSETDTTATAHFFYKRNSYDLAFVSAGKTVQTVKIEFEGLIKGGDENYNNYVPPYPSNLEPGAYEFKGWYLAENCATGTEVNWNTARMPVNGMIIYAKWEPVVHDVKITGEGVTAQTLKVTHGNMVTNPPADPTKDGYEFISWFYTDNGVEKAFSFDMPITKNISIYPKWKGVKLVNGVIRYQLEDGTQIADDMTIQAYVDETKTYDAKATTELYATYQTGCFPKEISHSIKFEADESKNVYTFVYVQKDSVSYTVKYLDKTTDKELAEQEEKTSKLAAVVEDFKPVAGYLPDLYKKTLILDADDKNELIFWYTKDTERAPLTIIHYVEKVNDPGEYYEYETIFSGYETIGQTYTETPLTKFNGLDINGFTYNETKSTASGKLTDAGLTLKLYYDRNEYPYEFRFVDENGNTIHEPVTGVKKFEYSVTETAKVIPGYDLTSADTMTIDSIAIEDTAAQNVKEFTYKLALVDVTITVNNIDTSKEPVVVKLIGDPDDAKYTENIVLEVAFTDNKNKVTIKDVPVGNYYVTTKDHWTWRYNGVTTATADIKIVDNRDFVVNYGAKQKFKWLNGYNYYPRTN